MNTTRLRIAVMGCIAPSLIAMLALNREDGPPPSGPVWGRVTYNGRPLDHGAVLFAPCETTSGDWAVAPIGRDGMYSADTQWRRGQIGKARFRMCIVPFPYTFRPIDVTPPAPPGEIPSADQPMVTGLPIPDRFTEIWTSGMMVTLDRESARVDVDLKD